MLSDQPFDLRAKIGQVIVIIILLLGFVVYMGGFWFVIILEKAGAELRTFAANRRVKP